MPLKYIRPGWCGVWWKHPRIRGEKFSVITLSADASETPPHTRGEAAKGGLGERLLETPPHTRGEWQHVAPKIGFYTKTMV